MNPLWLSRRKSRLGIPLKPHCRYLRKNQHRQRKRGNVKHLSNRMNRLRSEMEEIGEEQQKIKEGQRQVREKFEAIESECDQLRKETNIIMQQSASTQIRLAFMFQILKARENQEFDKAAQLTCALREFIARENQQREVMAQVAPARCAKQIKGGENQLFVCNGV